MQKVTYPAQFEYLDEIRELVGKVAREGGFSDKEIYSIQLAADEAASNIIEHAYSGVSDGQLEISCDFQGNTITIAMVDHGASFDISRVKKPNLKASLTEREIGGLGVYLMNKLMDEVNYKSIPGSGNLLVMKKRKG